MDNLYGTNFAADLEDSITPPAFNPDKWPSKEAWLSDILEMGYYWMYDAQDGWDENKQVFVGVPCTCGWRYFKRVNWNRNCVVHGDSESAKKKRAELDKVRTT